MGGKLIFLGTGGDGIVIGKQMLASGGLIIQSENAQVHIDPGPGSLVKAKQYGVNLRENTCILVSQNSLFRAGDVNASIAAMTHHGLDRRGVLLANHSVMGGGEGFQPYLNQDEKEMVERAIGVEPGQRVGINDVEINVTKSFQKDPNAIGFRVTINNITIGIPCDTVMYDEVISAHKGTDVLILNVPLPGDLQEDGMLNAQDAATMVKAIKPKTCLITGFGVKMIEADPREEARQIGRTANVHVQVVSDGQKFNIDELAGSL